MPAPAGLCCINRETGREASAVRTIGAFAGGAKAEAGVTAEFGATPAHSGTSAGAT
ncbi:hypothetical protein LzC2_42930 [Planctomycetes bacterium LzC2]|uniref:Uncharacterized protein n=1 Tax=Alienimonas chondri TaxID=2681879 RepID=A0ABX1VJB9_9PLAN|nr:hypothetical protein [Alienimonas chondri]